MGWFGLLFRGSFWCYYFDLLVGVVFPVFCRWVVVMLCFVGLLICLDGLIIILIGGCLLITV